MKKIFLLFICIAFTITAMAQGTSCSNAINLYPYTDCNNSAGAQYAGHYQSENAAGGNVAMTGTSTLNPACTSDNETSESVEWLQVTATTTSFTITNNTDYIGGGSATAEKRDYIIYSGTCGSLTQIGCYSEVLNGGANTVTGLTAGQTYLIMVSQSATAFTGYPTATGASTCITSTVPYTPTNDACSSPFSLTTNITYAATNANSTADAYLCSGSVENNAWYQWCAPAGWPAGQTVFLNVTNQICNSTQGLQLTVWNTGSACPTSTASLDVVCQNPGALTNYYYTWVPTASTCYLIELDGYAGTACAYDITVGTTNITCTPPATPAATNNGALCTGSTLNLTTPAVAGATYSWTGPNAFTSALQNPTISNVTTAMAGTYSVTITVTPGCPSLAGTTTVIINPNATITLSSAVGTNAQALCLPNPITNITYTVGGGGTGAGVTGLPAGVTGSYSGGVFTISGTPTATGTFSYTVTTTGNCTQVTATGTITVNPNAAITLTSAAGTNAQTKCINTAITAITYSVTGGGTGAGVTGLPAGVTGSFAGGIFTISGTPTATGTFNYTVTTTGTCTQATATGTITVTPNATITLTSAAGTNAQTICLTAPITTITYAIGGGGTGAGVTGLPAGVTGSYSGGVFTISGTPTATGTFSYTVTTTGTCTQVTATGTITVNPDAAITLTSAAGTNAQTKCINVAITAITYSVTGGGTGAGVTGLPAGVTGSFAGGIFTISGTPTATGIFSYTVTTTGTCTQATATGTITVTPNATITLTSAAGTNAQTICLTAPITTITYAIGGGGTGAGVTGLPAGVTGSFAGGVFTISGTPTATGTFSYTVTTTGTCTQVNAAGTITVNPNAAIVLTSAAGTNAQVLCINTAIISITYSITGGGTGAGVTGLPAGVTGSYAGGVFTISGTPTASGTFNYTVTTTGTCTQAIALGSITVNPLPVITSIPFTNETTCGANDGTITINATGTGLTYSINGGTSYVGTNLFTGLSAGSYTIVIKNSAGCTINGGVISINSPGAPAMPTVSATVNPLCEGATLNLSVVSPVGGETYTWSGPGGYSPPTGTTATRPNVTTAMSGIYTVTASVGSCVSPGGSITITVNPNAVINLTSAAGTNIQTVCLTNPITTISYSITGGGTGAGITGLPAGLTGSYAAGVFTISGTSTATGVFNYTVTTTGTCTQAVANGTITINPNAIITLTSAAGTDSQIKCINTAITAITYSITGGGTGAGITGLPAGITGSFAGGVFTISGTPSATGTFNYTVTTTGTCTQTTATGSITINPDASIVLSSAAGTDAQIVCLTDAITTITYSIGGGGTGAGITGLPAGITGSFAGGVFTISGTPTATGIFNYSVTTTGTCTQAVANGTITINPNAIITLTSAAGTDSQIMCINTAITAITYSITGGGTGAGITGLPSGITGSYAGGVFTISGTPTATGIFNYTVTTTGACTQTLATGSITVDPDATITLTSAAGTNAQTVCINIPITTITYTIAGGGTGAGIAGLPAGVTGSFAGGVFTIFGTPTVSGTFNYTVTTTGTCAQAIASGSIIVNPDADITLTSAAGTDAQTACINAAITSITYSITGGGTGAGITGLPTGVIGSFAGGVFTISGTATTTGTFNYTVTTTGNCSQTTAVGSIIIDPDAAIALTSAVGTDAQTVCINTAVSAITYSVTGGGTGAGVAGLPAGVTGSFSGGVFTITGTPTVSGTFNYTVTTTGTCAQTTASGIIIVNSAPNFTVTQTNPSACGASDGTITLSGLTANTAYNITYTAGATTNGPTSFTSNGTGQIIISGLTSGGYTDIIASLSGCSSILAGPYNLSDPGSPTFTVATSNPTTCGGTSGTITLSGLTANTSYNVTYTNGATVIGPVVMTSDASGTIVLIGLSQGSYSSIIVGLAGCNSTDAGTYYLTDPGLPTFTVASSDPTTCGGADGTITLSGLTLTTSYSITYANGATVVGPVAMTSDASGTILINGLTQGSYTNITVGLAGCNGTEAGPYNLSDPALPTFLVASGNPTICGGADGTITLSGLTASTSYSITYTNGATVVGPVAMTSDGSGNILINGLTQGSYTNIIVGLTNCNTTDAGPYNLTDPGSPSFTIVSGNPTTCGGTDGTITLSGLTASTSYTVTYTNGATVVGPAAISSNASGVITISGLSQGTYTNIIVALAGCSTTDPGTYNLTDPGSPAFTATSSNPTTCGGTDGTITLSGLTASTSYTVTYTNGATVVGPAAISSNASGVITISGLSQGTYTNIIVALAGCSTADAGTYNLTDPGSPAFTAASSNPTTCSGSDGTITLSGLTASTSYTVIYTNGTTVVGPAAISSNASGVIILNTLTQGSYSNIIVTLAGCSTSEPGPYNLTDPNTPAAPTAGNTGSPICEGSSLGLTSNTIIGATYHWTSTNTFTSSTANPTVSNSATAAMSGTYSVTVTVAGCTSSAGTTNVTVNPNPIVNAGTDATILSGSSITLTATGGGPYVWSTGEIVNPITVSPTVTTQYCVTVVDVNSCSDSDCVRITVEVPCGALFVPQAFSPNGDNENDVLQVYGDCITYLEFAIFDRWGEKVFETSDSANTWDGTYKGKKLDPAVFVYYLKATVKGESVSKHGNITLTK